MFPSGLGFPRLCLWSVRLSGRETLLERSEFWAELQQLEWLRAAFKEGMNGKELWGEAGACWAVSLGTGMGMQPRHPSWQLPSLVPSPASPCADHPDPSAAE